MPVHALNKITSFYPTCRLQQAVRKIIYIRHKNKKLFFKYFIKIFEKLIFLKSNYDIVSGLIIAI